MKLEPRRAAKYYYLRFIRLRGKPVELARGVAIGTFIGITPTIPFHTVLTLVFAMIMRGSKVSALLSTIVVSNPITFFPQYYISFRIGNWLTRGSITWERVSELMDALSSGANFSESLAAFSHLGLDALFILLLGGSILATPFTIAAYLLSLMFFKDIQQKRLDKQNLN